MDRGDYHNESKISIIKSEIGTPNPDYSLRINFFQILLSSLPATICIFSQFTILLINLRFMSQNATTVEVNAVGLGNNWLSIIYISVIVGLNTGTSTFAAQAFGALNYQLAARYFHRAFIMRMVLILPSYGLCFLSYKFYKGIGVDEEVAYAAWKYCVHSIGAMIGLAIYDTLKSFIMAHNIFIPPMIAQILVAIAHWLWCMLFVERFGFGIEGVTYAFAASELTGAGILLIFIFVKKDFKNTRDCPTKDSLQGIWSQFKNEAYIAAFLVLEWLAFACCTLIAGLMDEHQLAAQSFTYTIITTLTTPSIALSTIGTIIIAKSLGQKFAKKARVITKAIFMVGAVYCGVQLMLMLIFKKKIALFLTNNEAIQQAMIDGICTYLCFMPLDILQVCLTSILKGVSREKITAFLYLVSFYFIGLTLAYLFGIGMEKHSCGIWLGMGIGISSMAIMSIWLLWKTDFDYQIIKIETRLIEDESLLMLNEESILRV